MRIQESCIVIGSKEWCSDGIAHAEHCASIDQVLTSAGAIEDKRAVRHQI